MNLAKMSEMDKAQRVVDQLKELDRVEIEGLRIVIETGIAAVETRDMNQIEDWAVRAADFLPDEQETK